MAKNSKNKPKSVQSPSSEKKPRIASWLPDTMQQNPSWQLNILDLEGPWGWSNIDKTIFANEVLPKIQHLESMSWNEIVKKKKNNHSVGLDCLIKKARKRLSELKLEDIDELFSLRLSGKNRIYGIRDMSVLKILWWDPEHEVCPSPKKHT